MKSIPVRVSRARMLRPSRPMMRPFNSSDLSSTTETVVSTAWLEATRCMTVARMLRARRSASWRVSSSTWRISRALSWRSSSSSSRIMICFAWPALSPATRSSSRSWSRFAIFSSSRACSRLRRRSSSERSRSSSRWLWSPSELSVERRRSSRRASSERRARSSSSISWPLPPGATAGPAVAPSPRSGAAGGPAAECAARGRCTSSATATATAAATSAANTISIWVLLPARARRSAPQAERAPGRARAGAPLRALPSPPPT